MSITYGASAGTQITSPAMTEALPSQTQQTGNNTVVVSDTLGNIGGGNIGNGTNGVGDSYVGRYIIINLGGGSHQERRCTADAAGTGTTRILAVDEDWDTNPVATTDTVYVAYEIADIEDGGAGGGIQLNSKTGLWEVTNVLTVNSTGLLQMMDAVGVELDDQGAPGAANNLIVQSGGWLYCGRAQAAAELAGMQMTSYQNAANEPTLQVQSGGHIRGYDTLFWAQLVALQWEIANGGDGLFKRCRWAFHTYELSLYDSYMEDCAVIGKAASTDIVRLDAGSSSFGIAFSDIQVVDSAADTTTETITMEGMLFSNVPGYVDIRQNKTWISIDGIGLPSLYSDFTWTGTSTGNSFSDNRAIKVTVATAAGTLLQDALVNVYENTVLGDLVLELTTDADGYAEDSYPYLLHETNSSTTTYGGHALQVGKWLYTPQVFAQVTTSNFIGSKTLTLDPNILQTTQATAITDGSGITWNEDANASAIIKYTAGVNTLAVGETVTGGTSGATGIVTEILDGDSVAGTVHLKTRNATAFTAGGESLSSSGTWTGTLTASSEQRFAIWIDANSKSLQTLYDYLAALMTQTTLSATGELIWEWCRDTQAQALYLTGAGFSTERSSGKGIIVVNAGAGTIEHYTDDAGGTYVPPASATLEVTVSNQVGTVKQNVYVRFEESDGTLIAQGTTNASGVFSTSVPVADLPLTAAKITARRKDFEDYDTTLNIPTSGFSVPIGMQPDPDVNLP